MCLISTMITLIDQSYNDVYCVKLLEIISFKHAVCDVCAYIYGAQNVNGNRII